MRKSNDSAVHRLPTHEQITQRAQEIFLERGSKPGHELDDWLQAEYELMQLPVSTIAKIDTKGKIRASALVNLVQWAIILGTSGITKFQF